MKFFNLNIVFLLLFFGLSAHCQEKKTHVNTLSKKEVKEGWQLLFDGKTTDGWRGYNKSSFPEFGWTIEDGCFRCLHSGKGEAGNGGDIITKKKFSNFELKLEWKIAKSGNSGIMYLVTEIPGKPAYYAAPEMQVVDTVGYPRKLRPVQQSGSAYELVAATPQNVKPHGEWNQIRILVNNGHVEHWQNGKKVVEYNLWTPEWKELVANSKFKDNPEFLNMSHEGYIALQDHGGGVWFRNIKIREL